MRRWLGVALALVMVVATGAAASAQGARTGSPVFPGQSVGTFRLGQDVHDMVRSLGPIHSEDDIPGGGMIAYFWPLKRVGAIADKASNKIVALVVSMDDGYQTDKGVGAGTEMDSVRTAYGHEDSVDSHEEDDTLVYNTIGVAFLVDKSGALGSRVSAIFVFNPGQYKSIFQQQQP